MKCQEGDGFILRCGHDAPLRGWLGVRQLDAAAALRPAPWMALRLLEEAAGLFPLGLDLLWDAPASWLTELPQPVQGPFLDLLCHLPGLTLRFREEALLEGLQSPAQAWFHSPQPPAGPLGHLWRQGWIGWTPDATNSWGLPTFGLQPQSLSGCLWGEIALPLGALPHLDAPALSSALIEAQARLERALSLRLAAGAWPSFFPFRRRQTGWRLSLLGGHEFQAAGGNWDEAARRAQELAAYLAEAVHGSVELGICEDPDIAENLGHQAMRRNLPWRHSLPLPPASPAFTPGLAADPREPSPLEARAALPAAFSPLLHRAPTALLCVPALPQEQAVAAFVRGLDPPPAIRWLPPEVPPPAPFDTPRPWAAPTAFPPPADVTQALQPSLFDDLA